MDAGGQHVDEITLADVLRVLYLRRWWIIVPVLACLLLSGAFLWVVGERAEVLTVLQIPRDPEGEPIERGIDMPPVIKDVYGPATRPAGQDLPRADSLEVKASGQTVVTIRLTVPADRLEPTRQWLERIGERLVSRWEARQAGLQETVSRQMARLREERARLEAALERSRIGLVQDPGESGQPSADGTDNAAWSRLAAVRSEIRDLAVVAERIRNDSILRPPTAEPARLVPAPVVIALGLVVGFTGGFLLAGLREYWINHRDVITGRSRAGDEPGA